jgi:hypothetical protein
LLTSLEDRVMSTPVDGGLTRRALLQCAGVAAAGIYLLQPGTPPAFSEAAGWANDDYWAFADRMQSLLEPSWDEGRGAYYPRGFAGQTSHNASLLYTHAAAARAGHTGACRQDARARALLARLCASPPWRPTLTGTGGGGCPTAQPTATASAPQPHACGWGASLNGTDRQHVVIDTAVVRGLAQAYFARAELGLSGAECDLIRDRIAKAANSTFYAYPALRLNQINWPIEIYAQADAVLGSQHLLQHDCRLQLGHFADALTHPVSGMRSANTGPGYRFHYLPQYGPSHPANLDSAEYATIVCGALLFYGQARTAGMAALEGGQLARLRAWVERVLCGYWTHAGYLNWDTGLGFSRWQQVKKPPLCQQSLLAIALSPHFQPDPAYGRWARYMFDRGLELFDRIVAERHGLPPQVMFGVKRTPSAAGDSELAIGRLQANAAQACVLGLARVRSEQPPPLYAYDPDIGRLAITTPAYNTAIVAVNQGAFPYGGVELARLFDGDQRVAANIGGRPPASFGVVVRNRRTGHQTATQRGRLHPDLAHPPLRLVKAPRGAVEHPRAYPRRAYAGPFQRLEAVGSTHGPGVEIHTRHRFTRDYVQTWWRILASGSDDPHDVSVLFPSTGDDVTVTARLRDGQSVVLGRGGTLKLADVAWLHIGGEQCGYVVVPRSASLPGRVRLIHPNPQASAPRPGPTVRFELIRDARLRSLTASVRIAPARGLDAAATVSRALGAGAAVSPDP